MSLSTNLVAATLLQTHWIDLKLVTLTSHLACIIRSLALPFLMSSHLGRRADIDEHERLSSGIHLPSWEILNKSCD